MTRRGAKEVPTAGIGTKERAPASRKVSRVLRPWPARSPKEATKALASFKLEETFDLNAQYHLFRVDPTQTNRVWFHTRTPARASTTRRPLLYRARRS